MPRRGWRISGKSVGKGNHHEITTGAQAAVYGRCAEQRAISYPGRADEPAISQRTVLRSIIKLNLAFLRLSPGTPK
jgi:hypothetical protein